MSNLIKASSLSAFVILFSVHALSSESFDVGTKAELTPVRGTALAQCQEPGGYVSHQKNFSCQGWVFLPEQISYFVGQPGLDADTIRLTVTHEDGGRVDQKQKYDPQTGKSQKPFSLFGGSLFNKALMEMGKNRVLFEYLKSKQVVRSGEFDFLVSEGKWITCPTQFLTGTSHIMCYQQTQICDHYFYKVAYSCGF